ACQTPCGAARVLGHQNAVVPRLLDRLQRLCRVSFLLIDLSCPARDLLACDLAREIADHALLVGQGEVVVLHREASPTITSASTATAVAPAAMTGFRSTSSTRGSTHITSLTATMISVNGPVSHAGSPP